MIYKSDHQQKIDTPEGTAVIVNKYKDSDMQINIYVLKQGASFHLNPPGNEDATKSYWLISGCLHSVDEKKDLLPGDMIILKASDETFSVFSKEETHLLVHSLMDNAFEKTTENFRYIYNLLCSIQEKDTYTLDHSNSVNQLVKDFAIKLGYKGKKYMDIIQAAKYHDVGKIYIPDNILNKPSKLSDEEYNIMKEHVLNSESLLNQYFSPSVFEIASQHHERLDGSGYPNHLREEEISEAAKIIAICDSYDAMTTNRIYKNAKSHEEAIAELRALSGTKYDESLVEIFIEMLEENSKKT